MSVSVFGRPRVTLAVAVPVRGGPLRPVPTPSRLVLPLLALLVLVVLVLVCPTDGHGLQEAEVWSLGTKYWKGTKTRNIDDVSPLETPGSERSLNTPDR